METQELHRGRLIDHVQLVVGDVAASQRFYGAVFKVLEIPMGGTGDGYFWADELFVSILLKNSDLPCTSEAKCAYEASAFRSAPRGPTIIEVAPESLCVAPRATGVTDARRDVQLNLRRPRV